MYSAPSPQQQTNVVAEMSAFAGCSTLQVARFRLQFTIEKMPKRNIKSNGQSSPSSPSASIDHSDTAVLKGLIRECIAEAMTPINGTMKEIQTSIEFHSNQYTDLLKTFTDYKLKTEAKIAELEAMVVGQQGTIGELMSEKMNSALNSKANNVVIFGLAEINTGSSQRPTPAEFYASTLKQIETKVGITVQDHHVNELFRMGPANVNRPRPLKLKFVSQQKKAIFFSEYLKQRSVLMASGIRVRDDLPEEVRKFRREAYPSLARIYADGLRVKFWRDALVVTDNQGRKAELRSMNEIERFKSYLANSNNGSN